MDNSHPLIILTGKTASGKDTVMYKLLTKFPNFKRVITTTSRKIREGEQDNKDYNFISESEFQNKINSGNFIEWVNYAGNYYGTEKSQILNNLNQTLIWRIDPSRAGQIRDFIKSSFGPGISEKLLKKVLVIYLIVDNQTILKRLKERGLSGEEIGKRMAEDKKFWQQYHKNYDFIVENIPGKLNGTVDKVIKVIENYVS